MVHVHSRVQLVKPRTRLASYPPRNESSSDRANRLAKAAQRRKVFDAKVDQLRKTIDGLIADAAEEISRPVTKIRQALYLQATSATIARRRKSAFNAFKSQRLKELNEDRPAGSRYTLRDLLKMPDEMEKYNNMTPSEKKELLLVASQEESSNGRASMSSKAILHACNKRVQAVENEAEALKTQFGLEYLLIFSRGHSPDLYVTFASTSPRMRDALARMGVNLQKTLMDLEHEILADGNAEKRTVAKKRTMNMNELAKMLRKAWTELFHIELKDPTFKMSYTKIERVLDELSPNGYRVVGYPFNNGLPQDPQAITKREDRLRVLSLFEKGQIRLVERTEEESRLREEELSLREESGEPRYPAIKERKTRCDKGVSRGSYGPRNSHNTGDSSDSEDEDGAPADAPADAPTNSQANVQGTRLPTNPVATQSQTASATQSGRPPVLMSSQDTQVGDDDRTAEEALKDWMTFRDPTAKARYLALTGKDPSANESRPQKRKKGKENGRAKKKQKTSAAGGVPST